MAVPRFCGSDSYEAREVLKMLDDGRENHFSQVEMRTLLREWSDLKRIKKRPTASHGAILAYRRAVEDYAQALAREAALIYYDERKRKIDYLVIMQAIARMECPRGEGE